MKHLKKYIGIYILAMLGLLIYWHEPTDEYPVWVMWLMIPVVLWKVPPFSMEDWFWGKVGTFFSWILSPFTRWQSKWPKWVQYVFAIVGLILVEEFFLNRFGYSMYPWRWDLSS